MREAETERSGRAQGDCPLPAGRVQGWAQGWPQRGMQGRAQGQAQRGMQGQAQGWGSQRTGS